MGRGLKLAATLCMGVAGSVSCASAAVAAGWTATPPVPIPAGLQTNQEPALAAVSCSAPDACTAIGPVDTSALGPPVVVRWDGRRWRAQTVPLPRAAAGGRDAGVFEAVSCPARSFCVVVGRVTDSTNSDPQIPSRLLIERWNGVSWHIDRVSVPGASGLGGVACTSTRDCTAVGGVGAAGVLEGVPLIEHWDGTRWTLQHTPPTASGQDASLYSVACPARGTCVAVGGVVTGSDSQGRPTVTSLTERLSHGRWTFQLVKGYGLSQVSCDTTRSCLAINQQSASVGVFERWSGGSWYPSSPPGLAKATLISCPAAHNCTAIAFPRQTGAPLSGSTSAAQAAHWDGSRWTLQQTPSPPNLDFTAISCPNARTCMAVGGTATNPAVAMRLTT